MNKNGCAGAAESRLYGGAIGLCGGVPSPLGRELGVRNLPIVLLHSMIGHWHNPVVSLVCLSVCLSVTLCTVALRVCVQRVQLNKFLRILTNFKKFVKFVNFHKFQNGK